jgi:hypothetical protein
MATTNSTYPALCSFWSFPTFNFTPPCLWFRLLIVLLPSALSRLHRCIPWFVFMPRERGRSKRASGSRSNLWGRGHSAYRSSNFGCGCSCHSAMESRSTLPTSNDEDVKPNLTQPLSSSPTIPAPNPANASNSHSPPPPHPGFTEAQREIIWELRRDNDEHKFRQDLMEKRLDWLLDSGAEDPQQRRNDEELLQAIMAPKWSNRPGMLFLTIILVNKFPWPAMFWSF